MSEFELMREEIDNLRSELKEQHDCISRIWDALVGYRAQGTHLYIWDHVSGLAAENKKLRDALDQSVKLQSHYASLLNNYDGGHRMQFASADKWIERLEAIAKDRGEA